MRPHQIMNQSYKAKESKDKEQQLGKNEERQAEHDSTVALGVQYL